MLGRHVAAQSEEAALGRAPLARDTGGALVFRRRLCALASAFRLILRTARIEVSGVFWTDITATESVQAEQSSVTCTR